MNVDVVVIDSKEYYVVDKVRMNNNIYFYLVSVIDKKDIMIRKFIIKDNEEYLVGLESEEEFNKVLETYLREKNTK